MIIESPAVGKRKVASAEELHTAAVANGAPVEAAAAVAAAVAPVIAQLPRGPDRPAFGVEPADFLVVLQECRR